MKLPPPFSKSSIFHNLIPCEVRISSISSKSSEHCKFSCPGDPPANLTHIFFDCEIFKEVGMWVFRLVTRIDFNATKENILYLSVNVEESVIWIISHALNYIWNRRKTSPALPRKIQLEEYLSNLYSDIEIVRNTKHFRIAESALLSMRNN